MTKSTSRKLQLKNSTSYRFMWKVSRYMDQYYIDGIAGLVPGGLGDMAGAIFSLVHVYFSIFKLRSIPLTLAILNNVMRDVLMGMFPFFIGDIIDFFNKAHMKNMLLIDGYVNDDKVIIHEINSKAWKAAGILFVLVLAVMGMIWVLMWLAKTMGTILFS